MPGDARADGRQAGRGGPLAALGDDGIEPDIGNEGSSVREAGERAEFLIVAASRDAADDLARRITLTRGATFGLHRASFVQFVVRLAMADMALRGFGHSAARADTIPDRETPARLEDVDIRPNRRMAPRLPAS
jgi:hypothetical protein